MLLDISVVVIAVCMLVLTIAMIPILLAIRKFLSELNKLTEQARLQTAPLVHDATLAMGSVRTILNNLERDLPKVSDGINDLRGTAADIRDFERMLIDRVERPLLDLTAIIAGISKGLVVFWRTLAHRR